MKRGLVVATAVLLAVVAAGLVLMTRRSDPERWTAIEVAVAPQGHETGALKIWSPVLPRDKFVLHTCEGLLDGDRDFGLFSMRVLPTDWSRDGDALSYTWSFPPGIELRVVARPRGDSVGLEYTVTNRTPTELARVHLHPCLPTRNAPSFYPPRENQLPELFRRVIYWSAGAPQALAESKLGRAGEPHVALMLEGQAPLEWAWWKVSPETLDLPLLAVSSDDLRHTIALGFERALWATANVGDGRACLHLFPLFGRLAPNESRTIRGAFYVVEGGPEVARTRFLADFPQ